MQPNIKYTGFIKQICGLFALIALGDKNQVTQHGHIGMGFWEWCRCESHLRTAVSLSAVFCIFLTVQNI